MLPAVALPLPGSVAVALAVVRVGSPIVAPVLAMALRPRTLGPCLVLAIIGIALALGALPAASAFSLAGNLTAVVLSWHLRPQPERPAAARTSPAFHRCISAQIACAKHLRRRRLNIKNSAARYPQSRRSRPLPPQPSRSRHQSTVRSRHEGGSIPMSIPGSIPLSVKACSGHHY
jgi:hypothetical protein